MTSYRPMDSKREEFRKYLEKTGVMDALTKALVGLYEEPDKPEDALSYVQGHLGPTGAAAGGGEDSEAVRALKREVASLKAEIAKLKGEGEPKPPEGVEAAGTTVEEAVDAAGEQGDAVEEAVAEVTDAAAAEAAPAEEA